MARLTDQDYLQTEQYKDASNLNARIQVHRRFSTNDYGWHRWVFDQFDLPARCDVLNVGCGPADLWRENEDRSPSGWAVTLSDLSPGMLRKALRNLGHSQHCFTYRAFDAQAIPFPNESFDAIVANHMLFHVPDRDRALSEMRRVLRPSGRFYAAATGHNHMREFRELIASFCPDADVMSETPDFTLENGAEELSRHFTSVTLHRYDDDLIITEVDPLIAYALSTVWSEALRRDLDGFTSLIRGEIAANGTFHIQKDSGMFRAVRA